MLFEHEKNGQIGLTFGLCYRWFGKCWYIHDLLKYEFDIEFDVSLMEWEIWKLVEGEGLGGC